MKLGRFPRVALALVVAATLPAACKGRKAAEIHPIEPKVSFNRTRVPLGSPLARASCIGRGSCLSIAIVNRKDEVNSPTD